MVEETPRVGTWRNRRDVLYMRVFKVLLNAVSFDVNFELSINTARGLAEVLLEVRLLDNALNHVEVFHFLLLFVPDEPIKVPYEFFHELLRIAESEA